MNNHTKVIKLLMSGSTKLKVSISSQIENLRGQMVSLGTRYGFLHPEVQQCSVQLDKLLLEYYLSNQVIQQVKQA